MVKNSLNPSQFFPFFMWNVPDFITIPGKSWCPSDSIYDTGVHILHTIELLPLLFPFIYHLSAEALGFFSTFSHRKYFSTLARLVLRLRLEQQVHYVGFESIVFDSFTRYSLG